MITHSYQMGNQYMSGTALTDYAPPLSLTVQASQYESIEAAKRALAKFLRRFADELEKDNHGIPGWVREAFEQ